MSANLCPLTLVLWAVHRAWPLAGDACTCSAAASARGCPWPALHCGMPVRPAASGMEWLPPAIPAEALGSVPFPQSQHGTEVGRCMYVLVFGLYRLVVSMRRQTAQMEGTRQAEEGDKETVKRKPKWAGKRYASGATDRTELKKAYGKKANRWSAHSEEKLWFSMAGKSEELTSLVCNPSHHHTGSLPLLLNVCKTLGKSYFCVLIDAEIQAKKTTKDKTSKWQDEEHRKK